MNDKRTNRTNAIDYARIYANESPQLSMGLRVKSRLRSLRRWIRPIDDFDWNAYPAHYRAEHEFNRRFFTDDLNEVDFQFENGKLYLLADCKPLNPTHRCLLEAICNLPDVDSIAEVGVGGGRYLANLNAILGDRVRLSGYDRSSQQLAFFKELFPEVHGKAKTSVMDLTEGPIANADLPDVVYASTVLMHIKRPDAYRAALTNLLASARKFVVLMDNWSSHDYFQDLQAQTVNKTGLRLYTYDSGANIAVVVAAGGLSLGTPYVPLSDAATLKRYQS
jgi:SAM-dependent methyltransferase